MSITAVLTADLVGSSQIPARLMEQRFQEVARQIGKQIPEWRKIHEFYRGDSFQARVGIADALKLALIWRAAIRGTKGDYIWDIRVAIGIGSIDHPGKTLAGSSGQAFHYSGNLLDRLKDQETQRIAFQTPDESLNLELNTNCILAEAIIGRWTNPGAATIFNLLLYDDTQESLATRMRVKQPAIHKRLNAANWPAVRHWEHYYRQSIITSLNNQMP